MRVVNLLIQNYLFRNGKSSEKNRKSNHSEIFQSWNSNNSGNPEGINQFYPSSFQCRSYNLEEPKRAKHDTKH